MTRRLALLGGVATVSVLFAVVVVWWSTAGPPATTPPENRAHPGSPVEHRPNAGVPGPRSGSPALPSPSVAPEPATPSIAGLREALLDVARARSDIAAFQAKVDRFVLTLEVAERCAAFDDETYGDLWDEVDRATTGVADGSIPVEAWAAELAAWQVGLDEAIRGAGCAEAGTEVKE